MFSKSLMLSVIDKVTIVLVLFIWNIVPIINFVGTLTADGFSGFEAVFNTWDIPFLDHDKQNSLWHLIKDKSGDLEILLKYFKGITAIIISWCALYYFVLYSKDLIVFV